MSDRSLSRSRSPLPRRSNREWEEEVAHWKGLAEIWKNSADAIWKGLVLLNERSASQENTIMELKKNLEERESGEV